MAVALVDSLRRESVLADRACEIVTYVVMPTGTEERAVKTAVGDCRSVSRTVTAAPWLPSALRTVVARLGGLRVEACFFWRRLARIGASAR